MKTDERIAGQSENLRDVLSQLKYINQCISALVPENKRLECENEIGHPLYNLKMSMYWLRRIDFDWRATPRLGFGFTDKVTL